MSKYPSYLQPMSKPCDPCWLDGHLLSPFLFKCMYRPYSGISSSSHQAHSTGMCNPPWPVRSNSGASLVHMMVGEHGEQIRTQPLATFACAWVIHFWTLSTFLCSNSFLRRLGREGVWRGAPFWGGLSGAVCAALPRSVRGTPNSGHCFWENVKKSLLAIFWVGMVICHEMLEKNIHFFRVILGEGEGGRRGGGAPRRGGGG